MDHLVLVVQHEDRVVDRGEHGGELPLLPDDLVEVELLQLGDAVPELQQLVAQDARLQAVGLRELEPRAGLGLAPERLGQLAQRARHGDRQAVGEIQGDQHGQDENPDRREENVAAEAVALFRPPEHAALVDLHQLVEVALHALVKLHAHRRQALGRRLQRLGPGRPDVAGDLVLSGLGDVVLLGAQRLLEVLRPLGGGLSGMLLGIAERVPGVGHPARQRDGIVVEVDGLGRDPARQEHRHHHEAADRHVQRHDLQRVPEHALAQRRQAGKVFARARHGNLRALIGALIRATPARAPRATPPCSARGYPRRWRRT